MAVRRRTLGQTVVRRALMKPRPDSDDAPGLDLATSVVLTGLAIADWIRDALRDAGVQDVRFSQLFVFARLVQGPVPVGAVAKEMGFSHQAASLLVAELERNELIRRIPNPDDRRSRLVELTPRGEAALAVGVAARDALLARLAASTTDEERRAAQRVVDELLGLAGGPGKVRIRDLGFPRHR